MGNWNKKKGLSPTDRRLLHFLWRWKLAPTSAVHHHINQDRSLSATYKRLQALLEAHFICHVSIARDARRFVWTLDRSGFQAIREELPLRDEGFRSETMNHDYWVSAIHLGPWLESNSDVEVFSEQQLRRFDFAAYPDWLPATDRHRPDGYWRVPYKTRMITIALEVELNHKAGTEYQLAGKFFSRETDVDLVVWVVSKKAIASFIQKQLKAVDPSTVEKHCFFLLQDVEKLGWRATVFEGCLSGRSLKKILDWTSKTPETLEPLWFLDASKTGTKSLICAKPEVALISNRVPPPVTSGVTSPSFTFTHSNQRKTI
jgi:hypothetical protein